MHTIIATLIGLFVLTIFVVLHKRQKKPAAKAAMAFCGFWLVASIVHFCIGVFVAGYPAATELAVHAVIFGVPALMALIVAKLDKPAT